MKLIVLHLTDLHLKDRMTYFEEKLESMRNIVENDNFSDYVLLLFSGDIVQSGDKKDYNKALQFLKGLIGKLQLKKKVRIAICPGNHDRNFTNEVIDQAVLKDINDNNFDDKVSQYSYLNSNYKEFEKELLESNKEVNPLLNKSVFKYDDNKVVVYSLNNALLSAYKSEPNDDATNIGNIYIAPDHLMIERENESINILIMHLPLSYYQRDSKKRLLQVINSNVDLVFTGHTHEESIVANSDGYYEFTSSALYEKGQSGFALFHVSDDKVGYSFYLFDEDDNYMYIEHNSNKNRELLLKRKEATKDKLRVDLNYVNENCDVKFGEHFTTSISNIFVFPTLAEKRYLDFDRKKISSFDKFLEKIKTKKIVIIKGDDESGKTVLANQLFHLFVRKGFNPLLTIGEDFRKVKTKKDAVELLKPIIKTNYLNNSADVVFQSKNLKTKVLIIDDSDSADCDRIKDVMPLFEHIIMMSNSHIADSVSNDEMLNDSILSLTIDVLYKAKRDELLGKIYDVAIGYKPDIVDNFNKEKFITSFEKIISKMDKYNSIDPNSILELSTNMLFDVDVHNSDRNWSHQKTKFENKLEIINNEKDFVKCDKFCSMRMLRHIAYDCYLNKINLIPYEIFEEEYNKECDIYDPPFDSKKIRIYLDKLIDHGILKKNDDFTYSFNNRKVFAFFVSEHIVDCLHNKHSDIEIKEVLSRGLYSSLNSNILLNISNNYNYDDILNFFVNDLYSKVNTLQIGLKDFDSISKYFEGERKRIEQLDKGRIEEIKRDISESESKQREHYLEHSEDFFYEKETSESMRELIDLINKSQVISNLLNSAPTKLDKEARNKLIKVALSLPNIIVDKYVTMTNADLERIYVQMQKDQNNGKKYSTHFISQFFDFLLSFVTATILGIYDMGSRPLDNPVLNERLCEHLQNENESEHSPIKDIQRFMIMSFSVREKQFITGVTNYLDNKSNSEFNKNCIRLIGRRYCIENYDTLIANGQRSFIDKISNNNSMSILLEYNKDKTRSNADKSRGDENK